MNKIKNIFAIILVCLFFASCTMFEKAERKEGSSVSFKLDSETVQKIKDAAGESSSRSNARAAEGDSLFVEVSVHGGYEKSTTVQVQNEATISIDNIPMGSEIYLEATAYIQADGERQNLYKGHSKKFVVRNSENLVMFILYRVGDAEDSEGGSGSSSGAGGSGGSGTGGGGTGGGGNGSGGNGSGGGGSSGGSSVILPFVIQAYESDGTLKLSWNNLNATSKSVEEVTTITPGRGVADAVVFDNHVYAFLKDGYMAAQSNYYNVSNPTSAPENKLQLIKYDSTGNSEEIDLDFFETSENKSTAVAETTFTSNSWSSNQTVRQFLTGHFYEYNGTLYALIRYKPYYLPSTNTVRWFLLPFENGEPDTSNMITADFQNPYQGAYDFIIKDDVLCVYAYGASESNNDNGSYQGKAYTFNIDFPAKTMTLAATSGQLYNYGESTANLYTIEPNDTFTTGDAILNNNYGPYKNQMYPWYTDMAIIGDNLYWTVQDIYYTRSDYDNPLQISGISTGAVMKIDFSGNTVVKSGISQSSRTLTKGTLAKDKDADGIDEFTVYGVSSKNDTNAFAGPQNIIAVSGNKLYITDNGLRCGTSDVYYLSRIVEFDTTTLQITGIIPFTKQLVKQKNYCMRGNYSPGIRNLYTGDIVTE